MNEFKQYHPIVNFAYFLFAIIFTCVFLHPVTLTASVMSAFIYSAMLTDGKNIGKRLMYLVPALLIMALVNPLFNHKGVTILSYFPGGNPLTLESVVYGIVSSVMIISVVLQFSCFNEVMTSDKYIYIFGKVLPALSLIFSMVLRFVPDFTRQIKKVIQMQKCVGRDISGGSIVRRIKNALSILSIMVTWSLENAVDTADSMKSRGYGMPGRTSFSVFRFSLRDKVLFLLIILSAGFVIAGGYLGEMNFECFPYFRIAQFSGYGLTVFIVYSLFMFLPVIVECVEVIKWKYLKSQI